MDVYGIAVINHRLGCEGYKTLRLRISQDTGEDAGSLHQVNKISRYTRQINSFTKNRSRINSTTCSFLLLNTCHATTNPSGR
jgi:hypothetical protein